MKVEKKVRRGRNGGDRGDVHVRSVCVKRERSDGGGGREAKWHTLAKRTISMFSMLTHPRS